MSLDALRMVQRADALFAQRGNFESLWDECTDYVAPYSDTVRQRPRFSGQRRGAVRYDSTAPDAANKLASQLGSTLTNPATKWFDLRHPVTAINAMDSVGEWLDAVREIILARLDDSNFYQSIDCFWLGLVGYGTSGLFVEQRGLARDLFVDLLPLPEYVFTMSSEGRLEWLMRRFELPLHTLRELLQRRPGFRSFSPRLNDHIQAASRNAQLWDYKHALYHFIGPRENAASNAVNPARMPVGSWYVEGDTKHLVAESGYGSMPAMVARWRVASEDDGWGRGPGITAMPDIRSLNEVARLFLRALSKDINPPLFLEDRSVIGSVRTGQNGLNYLKRGSEFPRAVTSGSRFDFAMPERQRMEQKVRQYFGGDLLEALLGDPTPNMTAYEYGRRVAMVQRMLGSTFGRLQREALDPVISRVFSILSERGDFPPPPPALAGGGQLQIDYVGPLARAQRFEEVESIQQGIEHASFLAQIGDTSALDVLDMSKVSRRKFELLGIPSDLLRSELEVAELQEERAQAAAQAQAIEQAQGAARAARDGAGAVRELQQ